MKTVKLKAENLYKVFGDQPKKALALINQGLDKDQIFAQTGHTLGVNKASFEVYEGEIFVVMGLSGSGKSTLVRLLNRLIEPTAGQIYIDNQEISQMSAKQLRQIRREKISMVFQSFALLPHMSVVDNAAFGLSLDGCDKKMALVKAMQALEQVGLAAYAHSYPAELSGGMQQRVGIARALATGSEIMLMDEAFSALDPLIRTEMQDELVKLQEKNRRTIIFISHDLDEAMRIGDRIAIMEHGNIVQIGTPEEILRNPATEYVESFFKGVSMSEVLSAKHLINKKFFSVPKKDSQGTQTISRLLNESDYDYAYLTNSEKTPIGVVTMESLHNARQSTDRLEDAFLDGVSCIDAETPINDIIGTMAEAPCPLPVVNEHKQMIGIMTRAKLLKALDPN
ncbi:glycine betaine/L-proline ABC transporter ATP-binding protein ProV [Thiomicrorhabdus sediminis]|uniref:Quaternary amine transport ATP-binding protein n=1 Tax=Thiomicrorhabdus sediminis TaxID=2580412 RepID=A0A4P9K7W3_9GAMM|nr:glycine betaine/L-proline ABC transporter ATP-binding protein ProV [Thiomicrorhabdus sediminis]QCU91048.1 glycine betaine/L-proline ABC transporter ATP-binding protein ProV [Thiomicrorhabdus sediminis]